MWKWILGVPAGLFVLVLMFGSYANSTPEGKVRANERATIDLCWQEQSKKSLDPSTARAMAAACEKIESQRK